MVEFVSKFRKLGPVDMPVYSGARIMMMPVILGDLNSIPSSLDNWISALQQLFRFAYHAGEVGYLTIDEKFVKQGETQRRPGMHVDGSGGWGGGGGGSWGGGSGNKSTGCIVIASPAGCRVWEQKFLGQPGPNGECDHLKDQCGDPISLRAGIAYWLDGLCVHESLPMPVDTKRQFVRLSLPSNAPWYEGYTENPLGVKPTGQILPRRDAFMDWKPELVQSQVV